jgi:hypothetical protein
MAAAWAGACRPGAYRAGDGAVSATIELAGDFAPLLLAVTVTADGQVQAVDVMLND